MHKPISEIKVVYNGKNFIAEDVHAKGCDWYSGEWFASKKNALAIATNEKLLKIKMDRNIIKRHQREIRKWQKILVEMDSSK